MMKYKFTSILLSALLLGLCMATHARAATYYVATTGNNSSAGTSVGTAWLTIKKAVDTMVAGDTTYIRGGEYAGISGHWIFQNSGTQSQPITLTNYPGERAVFKLPNANEDLEFFFCFINPHEPPEWATPKADYIHILGTDVPPAALSNGVVSSKGIVMQGVTGSQSAGMKVTNCDSWEIAGVDFVELAYGMFTYKANWSTGIEQSTDYWHVHNNRVWIFYRESGLQFEGDYNVIENNEIHKVTGDINSPYGCQMLNFNGHSNLIRGNILNRSGSTVNCSGILFEWDMADANIVEQNLLIDVISGVDFEGGDNNIVRNNIIYIPASPGQYRAGVEISSYDDTRTSWPCDEDTSFPQHFLPSNNPSDPDYQYYYNPRNCHSYGNQIYNNTIHGFTEGLRLFPLVGETLIIRNNVFSGWTRGSICYYNAGNGTCNSVAGLLTQSNNIDSGTFGFTDIASFNFRLLSTSPLIDTGYTLGSLNPTDFDGNVRPQGAEFDVGAFEFSSVPPLICQ